jgi:T-complex protein 1 subunit alpha
MVIKMAELTDDVLKKTAITTLSSKLIGPESDHFADIITRAMLNTKTTGLDGTNKYSVKSVSILKSHGQSSMDSRLIDGYALCTMRGAQGMPMEVKNARVACLDMSLNKYRLQMGVQILVNDPNDLEKIRQREMDITKERCVKLIKAGANVILCTKGIDEFAIKYFVEVGALAVRRCEKGDLRRIAKACGANVITTLADENGEESVDPNNLGVAESVSEERVGDNDYIFIRETKSFNIRNQNTNNVRPSY